MEEKKLMIKEIMEWILCIIIAVILALLVRYFIGTPTIVKQASMYPTLKQNQRLWLNRWYKTVNAKPERGEIITFEAPTKIFSAVTQRDIENPVAVYENEPKNIFSKFVKYGVGVGTTSYIKRIIGLPGERVTIKNGNVYIDEVLLEEDYLQDNVQTENGVFLDIIVPDGYVYVMGDNRPQSTDSRRLGCIPIEKIESKVLVRFWPLNTFGKVK